MPYIKREAQLKLDPEIDALLKKLCTTEHDYIAGEVEYCIFRLIQELSREDMCFTTLNELIGVLETTKLEVTRRLLGPLEDLKLIEQWKSNG